VRNRSSHRHRSDAGADERPWWEDAPGDSVFDRPTAAGRPDDPWAASSTAQAARDVWSNAPTRADHWGPDATGSPWRDPWPPDPGPGGRGGAGWEPDQRTVRASPAYQTRRDAPPSGYPPAGEPAATQRTAVWPAFPYADEPEVERRAARSRRPRDDGPGPGRRRRDRADRDRRGFPLGFGALVGLAGLGCFLAALLVLPWFQVDGRDVGLEDIADGFALAETQPDDVVDGAGEEPPVEGEGLPTPDEVVDTAEQEARDAAGAVAAEAIDSGRARYLDLYTDTLWMGVAGATAAAVLLSTILAPRSFALSLLLGFRTLAGLATVAAAGAHGVALWVVFSGSGAPDPAWPVWLGVGGLAGVLLGCIIGPKR
jgi:hypothetical protein